MTDAHRARVRDRLRARVRVGGAVATLLLVAAAFASGACGVVPLPCDVTIAAVPADTTLAVGDALPDDLVVIVAPSQVDRTNAVIERDESGQVQIIINATGDGAARLADYTTTHVGDGLAIAINGVVVSVPIVTGAMLDGAIAISPATDDQDAFVERFAGCIDASSAPTD